MSQPENRLQKQIVKRLTRLGHYAVRQRLSGRKGWPDLYVILRCCSRAAHFEVKRPGGKATKLQLRTLDQLADAGAIVGVIESTGDALILLEAHRCGGSTP